MRQHNHLMPAQVVEIKKALMRNIAHNEIARCVGTSRNSVSKIARGETWKSIEVEGFSSRPKGRMWLKAGEYTHLDGTPYRFKGPSKISEDDVRVIRKRIAAGEDTREIADDYNLKHKAIRDIKDGKRWKWVI